MLTLTRRETHPAPELPGGHLEVWAYMGHTLSEDKARALALTMGPGRYRIAEDTPQSDRVIASFVVGGDC